MVSNLAYNGSHQHDPLFFYHYNVSYLSCIIEGTQYPSRAYTPSFATGEYVREFSGLYQSIDQNINDPTLSISREDWVNGNTIFGFNLTPDLSHGYGSMGYINELKRGSMRIELRFRKPLVEAINVIVFSEFDNTIEVDKHFNVTTDYN